MYNLLIIDDEQFALEAMKQCADWNEYEIDNVFEASNADEALEILENNPVHIIICDIQMPQTDGIELMQIVNEKYNCIPFIFLTAHGNFEYAQRAIELGCFRYILKPINYTLLKSVVSELVNKIKEEAEENIRLYDSYNKYYNLWKDHCRTVNERFWQDLLAGRIVYSNSLKQKYFEIYGIEMTNDARFLLGMITCTQLSVIEEENFDNVMQYGVCNIAEELFSEFFKCIVLRDYQDNIILILTVEKDYVRKTVEEICEQLISIVNTELRCRLACYISKPLSIRMIKTVYDQMIKMHKAAVGVTCDISFLPDEEDTQASGENSKADVIDIVNQYINEHYTETIDRDDLAKLIYLNPSYLSRLYKKKMGRSISDYITYVRMQKAKELLSGDDDIGKIGLDVGYDNMSHFSRMFKKTVGMTPHDYRRKIKQQL